MTKAFFSFDYSDLNNATIIQNAFSFKRVAMPVFIKQAKWNEIIGKGEDFTKKFVKNAVLSSDVTVFLVGENTFRYKMATRWPLRGSVTIRPDNVWRALNRKCGRSCRWRLSSCASVSCARSSAVRRWRSASLRDE